MFYPIVEHKRFGSLDAMCRHLGVARELIDEYIGHAAIHRSDVVVCDRLTLGNPDAKICAVLMLRAGGAVVLCCGMFADMSTDLEEIKLLTAEFALAPKFKGKLIAIGEFRPAPKGTIQ